eukprot:gene27287-11111_t
MNLNCHAHVTSIVWAISIFAQCVGLTSATAQGRFVRIQFVADIINLAEVQAFAEEQVLLTPDNAQMSSTHSQNYAAEKCIDGSLASFCHTDGRSTEGSQDLDPWLRIDYGKSVDIKEIVVNNRVHMLSGECSVYGTLHGTRINDDPFAFGYKHPTEEIYIFAAFDHIYIKMTAVTLDAAKQSASPASPQDRYVEVG